MLHVLSLVAGFALCGACATDATMSRFVRAGDDTLALSYFDSLRTGRFDYAVALLAPVTAGIPGIRDSLVRIATFLPAGPLDSLHLIGVNRFRSSEFDQDNLTYEYHSARGWGVVAIAITGSQSTRLVGGLNVNSLGRSLEQTNAFTLQGKDAGHFLMLALLIACFASAVWVAVLALRTKMKRRWAWALLAAVGAGTVSFNWTTGQVGFQLVSLLFLDAALLRAAPAAPWILRAAFPIGALMTWRRIQQARNPAPTAEASVATSTLSLPHVPFVPDPAAESTRGEDTVAR